MKILHLSAVRNWGGGEKHIENLCLEMAKNHPEVFNIVLCRKGSLFEQSLKKQNLKYYTSPVFTNFDFRYAIKIIFACKNENIDLIHIHDPKALALAVAIDKFKDLPPFVFSKKTSFPIRQKKGTLYKYNYKKLEKILCVSQATRSITSEYLQRPERLQVIYHGTRLDDKSDVTPFQLREKLDFSKEKIIIGNIANHIEAKDLETFLKTARYLIYEKGQKNFRFVQIGKFSRRTKLLLELIEKWDLKEHVSLLGFLPEASNFIPQFDVSLMTSESEGIPQFIYESFYHKIPVVSTDVGGISEVITNNINGFLAPVLDYKLLADHILTLTKNPELKVKFAEISNASIYSSFTSEFMAKQTLTEYKNILDGSA